MMDKDNPCKRDCPDRSATCHAECERYAAYWKQKREENEKSHIEQRSVYHVREMMVFKKSGGKNRLAMPQRKR